MRQTGYVRFDRQRRRSPAVHLDQVKHLVTAQLQVPKLFGAEPPRLERMLIGGCFQLAAGRFGGDHVAPQLGSRVALILVIWNKVLDAQEIAGFDGQACLFERFPLRGFDDALTRFDDAGGDEPGTYRPSSSIRISTTA